ncbi:MAG: carboxypeptidase-like regulatory domain-containing protein [Bacteroidetes bacterium]|nr:MAG: carboxypeptidase-like regulatory domain-containing protein [Bacteroidota bacterium]
MSESISRYYVQQNPDRTKEVILKTKIDGVGLSDNSSVSQIIGSSFQEYNFYKNWMNIFAKDFVSPLADSWKGNYDYFLADTVLVSDLWCYKIEVTPHRKEDLAFEGIIWIDTTSFALKQIDVGVGKQVNVNFLEKMRIQQELEPTAAGPWLPVKTRVMVNVAQVSKNSAGLLAKFYTSNRDIVIDKRYPLKFFQQQTEVKEDAHLQARNPDFWAKARHDSLTPAEIKTYALIDTIKQVPVVKAYSNIVAIISSGYYTWKKIDVGNYIYTYAFNDVEAHRIRLGFRTNEFFSTKWEFKTYFGYGTKDERFKYVARLRYIPYRKLWTEMAIERNEDILQFAVNPDGVAAPGAFLASLNFFNVSTRSPFYKKENNAYIQRDIIKGVTQSVRFRNIQFEQIGQHFAYYKHPEQGKASETGTNFNITELTLETRLAKDERFYFIGNYRTSLGTAKLPIVTLRYTRGFGGLLGSDFDYHKFAVAFEQNLGLGTLGRSYYVLTASYTPSRIPYPLLEIHLGNRGYFYNFYGFGLMNFLEFVSDQHIGLNYEHNFSGLLFNRLPLFRKLKWRTFVAANLLVGSLRDENKFLIPDKYPNTDIALIRPQALDYRPYAEVGYGISNILKFLRVTFLHRLTYLDQVQQGNQPKIRRFGVFFSTRFEL